MKKSFVIASLLLASSLSSYALDDQHIAPHTPAIHSKETTYTGLIKVPQGSVTIVEQWGKFIEIADPGVHYYSPIITDYIQVDKKRVFVDIKGIQAKTADLQTIKIEAAYSYHVTDPYQACYTRENVEQGLQLLFNRSILKEFGMVRANDIISLDRDQLCLKLMASLNAFVHGETHKDSDTVHMDEALLKDLKKHKTVSLVPVNESTSLTANGAKSYSNDLFLTGEGRYTHNQGWGIYIDTIAIVDIIYPKIILDGMEGNRQAELAQISLKINSQTQKAQAKIQSEAQQIQVENAATGAKRKMELDAEAEALKRQIDTKAKLDTAQAIAETALIQKRNEAEIQFITIENKAKAEKLQKQLEAEALAISQQTANKIKLETAEAEAAAAIKKAQGETEAVRLRGEIEAHNLALKAKVYADNPLFAELEKTRILAEANAKAFSGTNTKVLVVPQGETDGKQNMFAQLLLTQQLLAPSGSSH